MRAWLSKRLLWWAYRLGPPAARMAINLGIEMAEGVMAQEAMGQTGGLMIRPWYTDDDGRELAKKMVNAIRPTLTAIREEDDAKRLPSR